MAKRGMGSTRRMMRRRMTFEKTTTLPYSSQLISRSHQLLPLLIGVQSDVAAAVASGKRRVEEVASSKEVREGG
jgi:hypothetical protein